MATTTPGNDTDCGPESDPVPDGPGPVNHVGVDGSGADHYHVPYADHVVVVDDGERVHDQRLGGRSIHDWIDHVAARRGPWERCHYHASGDEAFRATVAQFIDQLEEDE